MDFEGINRDKVSKFCKGNCQGIDDCYSNCLRLVLAEEIPDPPIIDLQAIWNLPDRIQELHVMGEFLEDHIHLFCKCPQDRCNWCSDNEICSYKYAENPFIVHAKYQNTINNN